MVERAPRVFGIGSFDERAEHALTARGRVRCHALLFAVCTVSKATKLVFARREARNGGRCPSDASIKLSLCVMFDMFD